MAKRSKLAIIMVHYRTPELVHAALAAVRADTFDDDGNELVGTPRVECSAVVVDNGSIAEDEGRLSSLDAEVLRPGTNLGYAGAVNLGVSHSDADFLVLMNADVIVCPGCIPRLVSQLEEGAAAAGPRFWWDHDHTLLLPPTERRTLADEALRALAAGSQALARRARRRWRVHAWRHWRATGPVASHDLSGGLLAVSREAWGRIGGFDDAYRLYFEETDWLHRLRRNGLRGVYEPRAEAVHLHARSVVRQPLAPTWFAESEARFRQRHYGPIGRRVLDALSQMGRRTGGKQNDAPGDRSEMERAAAPSDSPHPSIALQHGGERAAWVELAPGTSGFPAASAPVDASDSSWSLPPSIRSRLRPGTYTLQAVGRSGRELTRAVFSVAGD